MKLLVLVSVLVLLLLLWDSRIWTWGGLLYGELLLLLGFCEGDEVVVEEIVSRLEFERIRPCWRSGRGHSKLVDVVLRFSLLWI